MNGTTVHRAIAAVLIALVSRPLEGQGLEFACAYTRKVECTAARCTDGDIGSAYLLIPPLDFLLDATARATQPGELPSIRRCNADGGCTAVAVRATLGNPFVNIVPLEGTYFLKIASIDLPDGTRASDFVEVATRALGTVTHFGSCKGVVPGTVSAIKDTERFAWRERSVRPRGPADGQGALTTAQG